MASRPWTRDETLVALNLYCRTPFGRLHAGNPDIVATAQSMGRTPSALSMKCANLAAFDPALQKRGISGLTKTSRLDREVWDEFASNPELVGFESDVVTARVCAKPLEEVAEIDTRDLPVEGRERETMVRVRVNQSFFRRRILSAYDFRCCVTGIAARDLLVASHIIPWSTDVPNRLNPRNGLCLNALHDRAFDRGLMWVDDAQTVRFSQRIKNVEPRNAESLSWLLSFEGKPLALPRRFAPDPVLLRQHAETRGC